MKSLLDFVPQTTKEIYPPVPTNPPKPLNPAELIRSGNFVVLGDVFNEVDEAISAFTALLYPNNPLPPIVSLPPIQAAALKIEAVTGQPNGWKKISLAWCVAWAASISDEKTIYVPNGCYVMNVPLILRKKHQNWLCDPNGIQSFGTHDPTCYFKFVEDGTPFKTVLTRRRFRESASSQQDEPMVACVQIENEGIKFQPMVVIDHDTTKDGWLPHDPDGNGSDPSIFLEKDPNWDIGIFVGCRMGVDLSHGGVLGHHRKANLWVDVTRLTYNKASFMELRGWDDQQHNTSPAGVDGLCLDFISLSGGRWRYVMLGAEFKDGFNTYSNNHSHYMNIKFSGQPDHYDTLQLGEVVFRFVSSNVSQPNDVLIGSTLNDTLKNLCDLAVRFSELQDPPGEIASADFLVVNNNETGLIRCFQNYNSLYDFEKFKASASSLAITCPSALTTLEEKRLFRVKFTGLPIDQDTLTLGEIVFKFVNTVVDPQDVLIASTIKQTFNNLLQRIYLFKIPSNIQLSNVNFAIKNSTNVSLFLECSEIRELDSDGNEIIDEYFDFDNFVVSATGTKIVVSPMSRVDNKVEYYDAISNQYMGDNRGVIGASDVTGYRMHTTESGYLEGRRIWCNQDPSKNVENEDYSAGAVWIDAPAANSSLRCWGQRYISCRFSSYDPFIVRLGKICRITFLDCHTEAGERLIYNLNGNEIDSEENRYGSYTNLKSSLSVNIEGANAAPDKDHFVLRDKGSNVLRSYSGVNESAGSLKIRKILQVGNGSLIEDPATLKMKGGLYQEVLFGDNSNERQGWLRYDSQSKNIELQSTAVTTVKAGTVGYLRINQASIVQWQPDYIRINKPLRPDTNGSSTATVGMPLSRFGKGWINDLRMLPESAVTLTASKELAFEYVNDTTVRLKLRGSDGVTRSVEFTLAI